MTKTQRQFWIVYLMIQIGKKHGFAPVFDDKNNTWILRYIV